MKRLDAGQRLGGAAPARRREAQRGEFLRRVLADRAQAHDADAAVDGVLERLDVPALGLLARAIFVYVAVMAQRPVDRVLAHLPDQSIVHDTRDGNARRYAVVGEQVIDAHAERDDHLQVLEAGQQSLLGLPGERDVDIILVAEAATEGAEVDRPERRLQDVLPMQPVGIFADVGNGPRHGTLPRYATDSRLNAAAISAFV